MTVLLELTHDIHIYLFQWSFTIIRKLQDYQKNDGGVYYPKYRVQQTEDPIGQASKLKSFGSTRADGEIHSLLGNDFFITIAAFGFGPRIFPSKEVLRK